MGDVLKRSTAVVSLALMTLAIGCSDGGECIVAHVGPLAMTQADVSAFRSEMNPAPSPEQATRLLVDAWTVYASRASDLGRKPTVEEAMLAHRAWQRELRAERPGPVAGRIQSNIEQIRALRARVGVRRGDCKESVPLEVYDVSPSSLLGTSASPD